MSSDFGGALPDVQERGGFGSLYLLNIFFSSICFPSLFGSVSMLSQTCCAWCKTVGQALKGARSGACRAPRRRWEPGQRRARSARTAALPGPAGASRDNPGTGPAEGSAPPQSRHPCPRSLTWLSGSEAGVSPVCVLWKRATISSLGSLRLVLGSPLIFTSWA